MLVPDFVEDLQGVQLFSKEPSRLPQREQEQLRRKRLTLSWEFSMTLRLLSEDVMSGPNSTQPSGEEDSFCVRGERSAMRLFQILNEIVPYTRVRSTSVYQIYFCT